MVELLSEITPKMDNCAIAITSNIVINLPQNRFKYQMLVLGEHFETKNVEIRRLEQKLLGFEILKL